MSSPQQYHVCPLKRTNQAVKKSDDIFMIASCLRQFLETCHSTALCIKCFFINTTNT